MAIGALVREDGLTRGAFGSEAVAVANRGLAIIRNATGAGTSLVTREVAAGAVLVRSGPGVAFNDILPSAALLTAANPEMANGDIMCSEISNRTVAVMTLLGTTGVTAVAGAYVTVAAAAGAVLILTRTSATAWTFELA